MCILCLRPFRYLDKRKDCSDFPEFRVDTQHFIATVCSLVYRAECGSSGGARAKCREGRLSAASGGQTCAGALRPSQRKPRFAPAFFSSPARIVSYFLFLLIPLSLPTPFCVIGYSTFESCCAKARNTLWPAGSFCRQFPC